MSLRREISFFLFGIIICALIGCYFEVNKKIIADTTYIHEFQKFHPDIPIEEISVPAKHDYSYTEDSMHTVALIWFAGSILSVVLFSVTIYQRKKGK
jgi:hypothetical protein